jgi:hypothetical protein
MRRTGKETQDKRQGNKRQETRDKETETRQETRGTRQDKRWIVKSRDAR